MEHSGILSFEECKKIASDYCKKQGYKLGECEGKSRGSYYFGADDPADDGKFVGLPLRVVVSEFGGVPLVGRF